MSRHTRCPQLCVLVSLLCLVITNILFYSKEELGPLLGQRDRRPSESKQLIVRPSFHPLSAAPVSKLGLFLERLKLGSCMRRHGGYGQSINCSPVQGLPKNTTDATQTILSGSALEHPIRISADGTALLSVSIVTADSSGNRRVTGGDQFYAYLVGPSIVTADISDLGNGTYSVNFLVEEPGEYKLHAILGMTSTTCPQLPSSIFNSTYGCHHILFDELSGAQLNEIRSCEYTYVGRYGYRMSPSFPLVTILQSSEILDLPSKPICRSGDMTGRWVSLTSKDCPLNVCVGSPHMLRGYPWRPHVWAPYSCQYKLFSEAERAKCARLTLRQPIFMVGDSITAGLCTLLRLAFRGRSRKFPTEPDIRKPRIHTFQEFLSSNFVSVLQNATKGTIIFGFGGLHELTDVPGRSIARTTQLFHELRPHLEDLRRRGFRLLWLSPSATQSPVPNTKLSDGPRKYCTEHSVGKTRCPDGKTQCEFFSQRLDRSARLLEVLQPKMRQVGVEVINLFQITNHGQHTWHDDNVHFHLGGSGVAQMLIQIILNMLCTVP